VVVHEAGALHERVAGGGAHEPESAAFEVGAHRPRHIGLSGESVALAEAIDDGGAAHQSPQIGVERSELLGRHEDGVRVVDGRRHLQPVAHYAGVAEQPRDVGVRVSGDALDVEVVEGAAVVLALVEDRVPGEAGLRALQRQQLEQRAVVVAGNAPSPSW